MAIQVNMKEGIPSGLALWKFKIGYYVVTCTLGNPKYSVDGGSTWYYMAVTPNNTIHVANCMLWIAHTTGHNVTVTELPKEAMYTSKL